MSFRDEVVFVYAHVIVLCMMCCVYDDLLCVSRMCFLADLYFLCCFVHA